MNVTKGSGVYAITNTVNGKTYIGSTIRGFNYRWKLHIWELRNGTRKNRHLQAAWNKYGEDAFTFTVVEIVDDPALIRRREQDWIDVWRARKLCYNIADATGPIGEDGERQALHLTDEHKERISRANTGRKLSDETKKKIGDGNRGRKHSAEENQALSERMKARGPNEAFRKAGRLSTIKTYTVPLIAPDGTRYETITNLKAFCKEHNLHYSAMRNVVASTMNNHRGWRRADEEPITREEAIGRAVKLRYENPEVGAKQSRLSKAAMDDPAHKARCITGLSRPETVEKRRQTLMRITYRLIAPDGTLHIVNDLRGFCQARGLDSASMRMVHRGNTNLKSHKGWTKAV